MHIPIAEAQEVIRETLQEKASRIATEYGISTTTFSNLIYSESRWDPNARNEKTQDRGILQINRVWHPEVSDECALDPDCALPWGAQRIKDGYIHEWVPANCYLYVSLFLKLPKMAQIVPNSTPQVGAVAVFQYKNLKHIAIITKLESDGFWVKEANYIPAMIGERFVKWNDPSLEGFWR